MAKSEFYVRAVSKIDPDMDIVAYVHTELKLKHEIKYGERQDILIRFFTEYIKCRTKSFGWCLEAIGATDMAKKLLSENNWSTRITITKNDLKEWLDRGFGK